jgi:diguanylate cyclase (GGDEF)-like protein/PAS domain S-box-containing protein
MPTFRRKKSSGVKPRRSGGSVVRRSGGMPMHKARKTAADIGEIVRKRAEADQAMAEARRSHARLREAIDIMPEGVVFLDEDGRYILWNKKYAEIYHATADLFRPGVKLEDTLRAGVARGEYPEAAGREDEWIAQRLQRLYHPDGRHEQKLNDGRVILIEERLTGDGGVIGLRVDITELKQREASFRLLFDGNPVPMIVCATGDERILAVNDAAVAHYGYDRAAFECMSVRSLQAFESEAPWTKQQTDDERVAQAWKHVKADGSLIDVAIYSRELVHEGCPAMLLALIDITERRQAEARLAFMAQHDSLTGLPNHAMVRQRLDEQLSLARRGGQQIAVVCVNLDSFKAVNDALGHAIGDRLLKGVAKRLRSSLREGDFLARLSADEFVVIHPGIAKPEDAGQLAKRLIHAVGEPYLIEGRAVTVTASAGIAIAPGDGDEAERLLKHADLALSRPKAGARGTFSFFEAEMDAKAQERRKLEADLRAAIEVGALRPHYQPLVDLASGRITGFEALVRWPHPQRGMVPPSEFIPLAEETGLIATVGGIVLRQACKDAAQWPGELRVAVNLSPLQFRVGNLLGLVMDALKQSGLPAKRLELEITETVLMEKSEHVIATLQALRMLGVRMSMDDFGTGYSSLSYLRKFPFDKLKIDQSFVRGLADNQDAQAIVRAIVNLGRGLGVTVTAEGIETEAELGCLRNEGCNEGQGYLFSKARPQNDVLMMLARRITEQVA